MKIHRAAIVQFRCNLCLDWHTSRQPLQPASGINFCEQCFNRLRSGTSFKVLDPLELDVYELCLKRTGVPSDESRSINVQAINDLAEFYQRKGREEKLKPLFDYLNELEQLEAQSFQTSEPFRDFLNELYRRQLSRIEEIWKSTLNEIDRTATLIEQERKHAKEKLESYDYDVHLDEAGILDTKVHTEKLERIRSELSGLLSMRLQDAKSAFHKEPDRFFASDFSLKQTLSASQQLITEVDQDESQLLQYTEKSEVGEQHDHSYLPEESMLLAETISKISLVTPQSTERKPESSKKKRVSDKENLLNCTPLVFRHLEHTDSKPSKSTFLSSRKECTTLRDNFNSRPSQTVNKPRKIKPKPLVLAYPPVDLTTFKEWPRQRILELLNRRDNVPKGFGNKRPSVIRVYPERVMTSTICEALDKTFISNNTIELIGYATQDIQFLGYLEMLKWTPRVELVKFVKVGLTDQNFNLLLCFIVKAEKVTSVVVSNNHLTDESMSTLLNFCRLHQQLKCVYMGRNYINQQRCKPLLQELKQMGTMVYI